MTYSGEELVAAINYVDYMLKEVRRHKDGRPDLTEDLHLYVLREAARKPTAGQGGDSADMLQHIWDVLEFGKGTFEDKNVRAKHLIIEALRPHPRSLINAKGWLGRWKAYHA